MSTLEIVCAVIVAVVAAAGFVGTIVVQTSASAKMHGSVGQRLNGLDADVIELKGVQREQWQKIGEHGEDIAALKVVRPNGGIRG